MEAACTSGPPTIHRQDRLHSDPCPFLGKRSGAGRGPLIGHARSSHSDTFLQVFLSIASPATLPIASVCLGSLIPKRVVQGSFILLPLSIRLTWRQSRDQFRKPPTWQLDLPSSEAQANNLVPTTELQKTSRLQRSRRCPRLTIFTSCLRPHSSSLSSPCCATSTPIAPTSYSTPTESADFWLKKHSTTCQSCHTLSRLQFKVGLIQASGSKERSAECPSCELEKPWSKHFANAADLCVSVKSLFSEMRRPRSHVFSTTSYQKTSRIDGYCC